MIKRNIVIILIDIFIILLGLNSINILDYLIDNGAIDIIDSNVDNAGVYLIVFALFYYFVLFVGVPFVLAIINTIYFKLFKREERIC